jgi:MraZ protein
MKIQEIDEFFHLNPFISIQLRGWREMANGLLGHFVRSLDDKNRIVLPPELRSRLDAEVVVSRWYEHSLALFTESEYALFAESLHAQGSSDRNTRLARREIFGGATLVGIDKQGRMSLPDRLLEGVLMREDMDRDMVILGDWNKVLLFSGLRFRDMEKEGQVNLDEALSKVEATAHESKRAAGEEAAN